MTGLPPYTLALTAAATLLTGAPAGATQLSGRMTETTNADSVHEFPLWLEADGDLDFFYKMSGKGVVTESSKAYSLRAKAKDKPWGFGSTITFRRHAPQDEKTPPPEFATRQCVTVPSQP